MNLLTLASQRIAASSPRTVEARELLDRLGRLNKRDGFTLTHCLSVAAERFDEDARTMDEQKIASREIVEKGGRPFFTVAACEQLAEQFRRQAADARELIAVIEGDDDEIEEAA